MIITPRSLPLLLSAALGGVCSLPLATALAQNVEGLSQREIARREAALPRGTEALARGRIALQAKDYLRAHEDFRVALTYLPDAVVSGKARDEAMAGFCESGIKVAEIRAQEGKYNEAEAICRELLSERYDPNCRAAAQLLARLQEPGRINKTMGPRFIAKVEEVRQLLSDADGYYNSGRYDLAFKKYEQILNLDPYNVAARRGQEKINLQKTHYGEEAYNETRSRSLWQVQKGWENPVRQYGRSGEGMALNQPQNTSNTARMNNKLNSIIIPRIEFRDASIREALEFLRQQSVSNDTATDGRRGVDIVLRDRSSARLGPGSAEPEALPSSNATPAPLVPESSPSTPGATASPAALTKRLPEPGNQGDPRVSITLNDIPLGEALRYIANQANLRVKVEPYAVLILPLNENTDELITKRYHVPPEFFGGPLDIGSYLNQSLSTSSQGETEGAQVVPPLVGRDIVDKERGARAETSTSTRNANANEGGVSSSIRDRVQFAEGTSTTRQQLTNDRQLVARASAQDMLRMMGVDFPAFTDGTRASATFLPQSGMLIVRNTQDNLDMVDALVEQANASRPKQVEIESKFVEITQTNLKELGFDWLLGPFNITGNENKILLNGGSTLPTAGTNLSNFPVTGGNRSGGLAINNNAIDALLGGGITQALAPGVFGLSGLLTDPQFQVVIRALNQKKGIDLLSAPRVTTKSGQRAVIEIVREFRYPTTFSQPVVPTITAPAGGAIPTTATTLPVVAPSTPGDFTTRNTGVTLEVEPIVGADGITVDLNLVPQVVEFEGFINYGSPIRTINPGLFGLATVVNQSVVLTDNVINQPIFSTRKVNTSVSVWDGQTVVLGGLMREDVQKTEDRTPIIGDIPVVGRLFRTKADQHIKRNLVIFVTARVVNPGGERMNLTEEQEEMEDLVEPPLLPEVPMYKK